MLNPIPQIDIEAAAAIEELLIEKKVIDERNASSLLLSRRIVWGLRERGFAISYASEAAQEARTEA